jgi:hypothetical protein
MKLLMLTASLPSPTGGANARNYHPLKALARKQAVSLLGSSLICVICSVTERDIFFREEL